jgi:hypothetical protein
MNRHICSFGLLCPFQSGFRQNHSTTSSVLKVMEEIRLTLEDGQATVLVMLDFARCWKSQVILIQRSGGDVPELFIGPESIEVVPKVRNLGFVLNRNLTPVDHSHKIYSVLRSVKPHPRYTYFEVRKKLVVSLIMPHINYGNVVFSTVDSASQFLSALCS